MNSLKGDNSILIVLSYVAPYWRRGLSSLLFHKHFALKFAHIQKVGEMGEEF